MDKPISLSQTLLGYTLAANARRLSPCTLAEYTNTYRKLQAFLPDDPPLAAITIGQIRAFLDSLSNLSKKSLLNAHTDLSALWAWALREQIVARNIIRDVDPPRPEIREIIPFTEADVRALVGACDRTRAYTRPGQRPCANARPTYLRDRAIILLLLDTGMRATELCRLRVYQADLKNQRLVVEGKGDKERMLPISSRTAQALWKYLATRSSPPSGSILFATIHERGLDRQQLRHLVERIGIRAGVDDVHPHRFRHTFAITFLRNGGNVYALQRILGHSTMEMVKRYLSIAQVDIETAHRDASPVARWGL